MKTLPNDVRNIMKLHFYTIRIRIRIPENEVDCVWVNYLHDRIITFDERNTFSLSSLISLATDFSLPSFNIIA